MGWVHPEILRLLTVAGVLGLCMHAQAQSVVTLQDMNRSFTAVDLVKPAVTTARETNDEKLLGGMEEAMIERLANERKWRWQVGADVGWYSTSNIFLTSKPISDQILRPGGGVMVYYGDSAAPLDFTGQYVVFYNDYMNKTVENSFSQNAALTGGWRPSQKLSFQTAFTLSDSKGNNLDVGAQTKLLETNYTLSGVYQYGENTTIGSDGVYNSRSYENVGRFSDVNDYFYADYQLFPKFRVGLSAGGGVRSTTYTGTNNTTPVDGTTETDTGVRLRLNYVPTEKISLNGLLGWEDRSFSVGGSKGAPRIEISSRYQLSERTAMQLSAYERVSSNLGYNVIDVNQVTGVTASISQRFFNKITANLGGGFEKLKMDTASNTTTSNSGTQDYRYLQSSIIWNFLTYSNFSIYSKFTSRQASSVVIGESYDQTVFGAELMVTY